MSLPRLIVQAGFAGGASTADYLHLDDVVRGILDTATLAGAPPWEDISESVRSFRSHRGANRAESPVPRYEAGGATIELNDPDRRFDPTNLSGPYVSAGVTQVTPMRAIRVMAEWDGVTYDVIRGHADQWLTRYEGETTAICELTITDATEIFNQDRTAIGAAGAGENTGARINRILDSVFWSSTDRLIAAGDTTVQATTLADNAWTEMVLTQDTEVGELYIDEAGRVFFRGRQAQFTELRSTAAAAVFGDRPDDGVQTTINLARNPSVETDTAGWAGFGGSPVTAIAADATRAMFGTQSLLVTWGTGANPARLTYNLSDLVVGKTYTASVYVWVPTGSVGVSILKASSGFGTNTAGLRDQWVRLQVSFVATAASENFGIQIWAVGTTVGTETCWVDGLLVEEGGSVSTYVDGDEAMSEWDGTAHASSSRRLPELSYADVKLAYDDLTLANLVQISRTGGSQQVVEDAASRQLYLTHTHRRTDLTMQTDAAALEYANFILHQSKDPELRFSELRIIPLRDEDCLFPQVLGRRFGDRIRILRRPPGGGTITREVFIRGVQHDYDGENWVTDWVLQSATKWGFFLLDHGTLGALDDNALGF